MLFNSINFIIFFIIFYVLYVNLRHKQQNILLLISSYIFYGSWNYRFLSLILLSTAVDFVVGKLIIDRPANRKSWLLVSVIVNLSILVFFKYFGFFADSIAELALMFGFELSKTTLNIVLPVGISFYTFQTMSYTIDVYRGKIQPSRSLLDFSVFVAFFPQLVAGPIERATTLLPQIAFERKITQIQFEKGSWLILWGFFKKVVIADSLASIVDPIYLNPQNYGGPEIWLATIAFAFQIFCDFSGYSDIARGLAKLMGINLMVNFRMPYFSTNPQQFWQRWHISLSSWLKDYLYVSLGGNRKGALKTYKNLMLTMLLGGLWHGAAWNYVIWGVYHGILLIVHRLYIFYVLPDSELPHSDNRCIKMLKVMFFFMFVCYGWLLFRAKSSADITYMTLTLIYNFSLGDSVKMLIAITVLVLPLLTYQLFQEKFNDLHIVLKAASYVKICIYSVLLILIISAGVKSGPEFIYFQF